MGITSVLLGSFSNHVISYVTIGLAKLHMKTNNKSALIILPNVVQPHDMHVGKDLPYGCSLYNCLTSKTMGLYEDWVWVRKTLSIKNCFRDVSVLSSLFYSSISPHVSRAYPRFIPPALLLVTSAILRATPDGHSWPQNNKQDSRNGPKNYFEGRKSQHRLDRDRDSDTSRGCIVRRYRGDDGL